MKVVFHTRYHVSRLMLWGALMVMPPSAYRTELKKRVYSLKKEAEAQAAFRALPQMKKDLELYLSQQSENRRTSCDKP